MKLANMKIGAVHTVNTVKAAKSVKMLQILPDGVSIDGEMYKPEKIELFYKHHHITIDDIFDMLDKQK
jgi:hypothetical protein